jgi:hypothetical protein
MPKRPAGSDHVARRGRSLKVKRGHLLGPPQTTARAKSPAPTPLGGLRRLILGHASARAVLDSVGVPAPRSSVYRCARTSQYARSGRQPPATWDGDGETRKPSVDARRAAECPAAGAAAPNSRLAACGRISLTARGGRGFEGQKCARAREAMHADVASGRIVNTGARNLFLGPLPFFEKVDISARAGLLMKL